LPLKRKHWVALRYIPEADAYFNLDSKLKAPQRIGTAAEIIEFLRGELRPGDKELFLVVDKTVAETASWKERTL
jgi:josephin